MDKVGFRRLLRDAAIVARFDLQESVRSRLFIATLGLYALVAIGGSALFQGAVDLAEESVRAQLGPAAATFDLSETLRENPSFISLLTSFVGSESLARELVRIPPLALFNCWLGFFCVPLIVILTASDSIAGEVQSGCCRYVLFRTRRLSWALGKLLGQTVLMTVGIVIGSALALVTGLSTSESFDLLGTAAWMLRLDLRVLAYGFAFVGLAVGLSELTDSPLRARAAGLALFICFGIAGSIVTSHWFSATYGFVSKLLVYFLPGKQSDLLWQPELSTRLLATLVLMGLGSVYFALGYLRFGTRDV